jgi:hypothetical protein
LAERVASAPEPNSTEEREKRDLAAQEASALWAFWMLIVSGIGVAATMVGTGFLLWQIILTREAVEDTGHATVAMQRSNEIALRVGRPWLSVTITDAWQSAYYDSGSQTDSADVLRVAIELRGVVKNCGSRPALGITEHARGAQSGTVAKDQYAQLFDDFKRYSSLNRFGKNLSPGDDYEFRTIVFFDETHPNETTRAPIGQAILSFCYLDPSISGTCQTGIVADVFKEFAFGQGMRQFERSELLAQPNPHHGTGAKSVFQEGPTGRMA